MKDRDEAWMRVEALAMRHPNYNATIKGITNTTIGTISQQQLDSPPPDEDGDTDQTPLTLEKIEAKANEVWQIDLFLSVFHPSLSRSTRENATRCVSWKIRVVHE